MTTASHGGVGCSRSERLVAAVELGPASAASGTSGSMPADADEQSGGFMHTPRTPIRSRGIGMVLVIAALYLMLAPPPARADTVTDWNDVASTAIVGVAKQPPPVAVQSFALVQGAVYDAVETIEGRYRPYLATPPARRTDSQDAAAATAAFRVLAGSLAYLPADQEVLLQQLLEPRYVASLAAIPDGPRKTRGIADGEQAAAAMLAARHDDGNPHHRRSDVVPPMPGPTPGAWRPTPPNGAIDPAPWVANVRPFLVPDVDMLRVAG